MSLARIPAYGAGVSYHRGMVVRARAPLGVLAIAISALVSSCALSPTPLSWSIEVDPALRARVRTIEARILRGGCGGVPVFRVVVRADAPMGPVPPVLSSGVWGFDARANDATCVQLADDCVEITLPGQADVVNTLDDEGTSTQACDAVRCDDGECRTEDADLDGFDVCVTGEAPGTCDCDDDDPSVRPGAEDPCTNAADQDCDGANDACDLDCDGFPDSASAGDARDCDDMVASVHPNVSLRGLYGLADGDRLARGCEAMPMASAASDACTVGPMGEPVGDGVDQDCNTFIDDGMGCTDPSDRDRDGVIACTETTVDCDPNDCDPGIAPTRTERCGNAIDEDADGTAQPCAVGDTDGDGQLPAAMGGMDCDDSNPRVFAGAPDDCRTAVVESCGAAEPCADDADGDGYVGHPTSGRGDCNDFNPAVRPFADEDSCNGADDDCDDVVDEVVRARDPSPGVFEGCVRAAGSPASIDYDLTRPSYEHCGGCGMTTQTNQDCCGGALTAIDVPESCGGCGFECGPRTTCVANGEDEGGGIFACACAADPMGGTWDDCDRSLERGLPIGDGCETNLDTDPLHCGSCGHACGARQTCVDGTCTCDPGRLDCDMLEATGCEIDGSTDVTHCGTCPNACSFANAGATCSAGTCALSTCTTGFDDCDTIEATGCEASLGMIPNCGRCGDACALVVNAVETCNASLRCDYTSCDTAFGDCDLNRANGCEASLRLVTRCGTCATNCNTTVVNAVGRTCPMVAGTCDYASCSPGFGDCDGMRTNGCERSFTVVTSCGACGTVCGTGETCSTGGDCTCGVTVAGTGEACPGAMSCVGGLCV